MKINFQVIGIQAEEIQSLLNLKESNLDKLNIRKMIVDENPGYPCRLSLEDARIGEEVLLFNYEHHKVNSPYQASGPVFVRIAAKAANLQQNELPIMLYHRLLSLRIYNKEAMMIDARTIQGEQLKDTIQAVFLNDKAQYIQVHNSSPGCYNCQINRLY